MRFLLDRWSSSLALETRATNSEELVLVSVPGASRSHASTRRRFVPAEPSFVWSSMLLAARRILDTGAGQQRRLMNLASQEPASRPGWASQRFHTNSDETFVSDSPIKEEDSRWRSALVFFFSGSRRVATAIVTKRSLPHEHSTSGSFFWDPQHRLGDRQTDTSREDKERPSVSCLSPGR